MTWDFHEGENLIDPTMATMTLDQATEEVPVACACMGRNPDSPKWASCSCHAWMVHRATMTHLAHIFAHQIQGLIDQRRSA